MTANFEKAKFASHGLSYDVGFWDSRKTAYPKANADSRRTARFGVSDKHLEYEEGGKKCQRLISS